MSMKRYELTKEQWERIKSLLPPEEMGKRGRPRKDNPIMLNGMLWIVRSGAQWRELPETYGPWQSIYAQFAKWGDDGTLEVVFHTLSTDADMENLNMDSTCVRVHESANGEEKTADKAVGRTKSGWNTRLHAVVDGLGNPLEFRISAGNGHDSVHAVELPQKVRIGRSAVPPDRAYGARTVDVAAGRPAHDRGRQHRRRGARAMWEYISAHGASYVIPPQSNVSDPWPVDWHLYKERHLVKCFSQKIKWFRRIATRYDKPDASLLAFVYFAAIAILLL